MKIDSLGSSSYYYQLLASQKSNSASSTEETESLASLLSSASMTEQLSTETSETDEIDIESLLTQMNGDQQAMFMKMKMRAPSEEMKVNRIKMDELMESVAQTDITSMSFDEKKSMLSEVVTQMSTMHGQTVNTDQIENLSESEVTSILTDVKSTFEARQTEMAQGKNRGVRPSGPPPSGPPPSAPALGTSATSSTEEDDEITTLEALLEALAAEEEEETTETEENEKLTQLFQNTIDQYLKNQAYGIEDVSTLSSLISTSSDK